MAAVSFSNEIEEISLDGFQVVGGEYTEEYIDLPEEVPEEYVDEETTEGEEE